MLVIQNIGTLLTPSGTTPRGGAKQGELKELKNACLTIEDGVITGIYENGDLPAIGPSDKVLDAEGRLVTPGLVDCHTHLVFGGWRQHEVPLKLKGASYLEILQAGGGILDTVLRTREAPFELLYEKSYAFLDEMLSLGVTTVEAKSGYGLDLDNELKQLNVIKKLNETHKVDIVPTFLGAHAIPSEYKGRGTEFIDYLCDTVLPQVKELELAEFCDVFCEDSVFDVPQSRKMLARAKALGLLPKIHADEIEEIGGAELAGEVGAISAEHLIATGARGMKALSENGVIAALLPCTSFYLNKDYAKAKEMVAHNIPVAIASDFNPGSCPSLNLQLCINLGYLKYRLTPKEVLTAVTLNAACAVNRGDCIGSLDIGKQGDLVIWDAPDFEMVCYRFGVNQVKRVVKKGEVVK